MKFNTIESIIIIIIAMTTIIASFTTPLSKINLEIVGFISNLYGCLPGLTCLGVGYATLITTMAAETIIVASIVIILYKKVQKK